MKNLEEVNSAIFVIDMNNGFCEEGALADPTIKGIVPNIRKIIMDGLKRESALFFVNDKHTEDSVEIKRYAGHCITPREQKTIKELSIFEEYADRVFYKNSTCALFAPGMMEMLLQMKNLERIVITGCCTDICIMNFAVALRNFMDEWNVDIDIVVPINAVETFHIPNVHEREEANQFGYRVMESNGIRLVKEMD
ncbi:TPA: cysteine hydrolase [Candidatus Ventrenecus stercoripullorum]|nr:cysteine hydrolase [Candidatus Ventrenecus stercoripullorum]